MPATGTFVRAGGMETERLAHTAVRLSDNRVLLAVGFAHSGLTVMGRSYSSLVRVRR